MEKCWGFSWLALVFASLTLGYFKPVFAGAVVPKHVIPRSAAEKLSVEEWKSYAWPKGDAPPIVSLKIDHELAWIIPPKVSLFEQPIPVGAYLCRRMEYQMDLNWLDVDALMAAGKWEGPTMQTPIVIERGPSRVVTLGIAPGCALTERQGFVSVSFGAENSLTTTLTQLAQAQVLAKGEVDALPFRLTCVVERGVDRCANGPRAALADMNLGYVWHAAVQDNDGKWEFWETIWNIHVKRGPNGIEQIDLISTYPHPF